MRPENVNPHNFEVRRIIYESTDFSIAYGRWEEDVDCLAMRWNGDANDAGYPKTFGHPVWFIIPAVLTKPLATALLEAPFANNESILRLLLEEHAEARTITS